MLHLSKVDRAHDELVQTLALAPGDVIRLECVCVRVRACVCVRVCACVYTRVCAPVCASVMASQFACECFESSLFSDNPLVLHSLANAKENTHANTPPPTLRTEPHTNTHRAHA